MGYHQLRIKNEDIYETTFRAQYRHCEFIMLPFDVTNAPATFMCLTRNVLNKYLDKFALVFIDDILVYSRSEEEHNEHIRFLLQTLRENKLYAKFSKCEFYKTRIQYLGHIISKEGLGVVPDKLKAMVNCPIPKDVLLFGHLCELWGIIASLLKTFQN